MQTEEYVFNLVFGISHLVANAALLFLLFFVRKQKIISVRGGTSHFFCIGQIVAMVSQILRNYVLNASCFIFWCFSYPLYIGCVVGLSSTFFKNLILQRLLQLRKEFVNKRSDLKTGSTEEDATEEITDADDSDDELEAAAAAAPKADTIQTPTSASSTPSSATPIIQENLVNAMIPAAPMDTDSNKQRSQKIAKLIAITKKFSTDWIVFLQILAAMVTIIAINLLLMGFNKASISLPFSQRCHPNWNNFTIVGIIACFVIFGILALLTAINALTFYKELLKCKLKLVFIDNDPFFFMLLSVLWMAFFLLFLVLTIAVGLKFGFDSYAIVVIKALTVNVPATWLNIGVPIYVALYRQIREYIFSRRRASAEKHAAEVSVDPQETVPTTPRGGAETPRGERLKIAARPVKVSQTAKSLNLFGQFNPEPAVIEHLLNTKATYALFKQFSEREYSDENLYFYQSIKKLEKLSKKKRKIHKQRLQDIYDTFVLSSSPMSVNLPSHARESFNEAIKEAKANPSKRKMKIPESLVKTCKEAAVTNLSDVYRRFYASTPFRAYMKQLASSNGSS